MTSLSLFIFMHGEGNGNPLQCSCLENPRDGEPAGLPSIGVHRVGHDLSDLAAATAATILNLDNIKITDVLDILFNCYFNVINYNKCFSMVDTSSFVAAELMDSNNGPGLPTC